MPLLPPRRRRRRLERPRGGPPPGGAHYIGPSAVHPRAGGRPTFALAVASLPPAHTQSTVLRVYIIGTTESRRQRRRSSRDGDERDTKAPRHPPGYIARRRQRTLTRKAAPAHKRAAAAPLRSDAAERPSPARLLLPRILCARGPGSSFLVRAGRFVPPPPAEIHLRPMPRGQSMFVYTSGVSPPPRSFSLFFRPFAHPGGWDCAG